MGNINAKAIKALLGMIVLESIDAAATGGINLNIGPGGSAAFLSVAKLGNIYLNAMGPVGVDIFAMAEAVLKGVAKAKVEGGMVDITADSICQIEGAASVNINGSSEPALLGKAFTDLFKEHQHPSSVGPTGAIMPQYAMKILKTMSKKVFLG